jgi:hypothetical protein
MVVESKVLVMAAISRDLLAGDYFHSGVEKKELRCLLSSVVCKISL